MFLMRFTERAYVNYTEEDVRNSPNEAVRLTFSNSNFSPEEGHYLYNMYLDEYEYSEEVGFDGLMLNEHHNTPTCLGATMNLEAAILARNTKKPKIVLLGNPLPIFDNPIRLAEELAEIDMISGGRLVSGFVRGTGVESLATNTNPLHNRARFEEAHDLVIKTWTTPGPFRWEGDHYHFRVVNPFQTPLQKPHPPVWIPGTGSPETLVWCAERNYPYIFLETDPQGTQDMKSIYTEAAREHGYEPGPENFGYLVRIHVQDTDEKAYDVGKGYMVGNIGVGRIPLPRDYASPVGTNGAFTVLRAGCPSSTASTCSAASMATSRCASCVDAPKCGVATSLGCFRRGRSPGGSLVKTSRAAPASCSFSKASSSASSSTNSPRATLIRRAPGFIMDNCGAEIRFVVPAVSGVCRVMKSDCARTSSSDITATPMREAKSGATNGSNAMSRIPKLAARRATSEPTRPNPTMPSVLFRTSMPMNAERCHWPSFIDA